VTKVVTRQEWHVLRHLNAQQQPNVPFAYALDEREGDHLLVCMQDVGDTTRPTSLEPITNLELEREAAGLASIHSSKLHSDGDTGLAAKGRSWLPGADAVSAHLATGLGAGVGQPDVCRDLPVRDQGVGGALPERVFAVAQQAGIQRFVVGTLNKETDSMLKFYRSHGFTPWRIQFFK
jgi:GNAT superfamily N-acetyltransferase